MCRDRSETDVLSLTDDLLSIMLAVRRPSVTTTMHILEGDHLIRTDRAIITVLDRDGLEQLAGGAYRESAVLHYVLFGREVPHTETVQELVSWARWSNQAEDAIDGRCCFRTWLRAISTRQQLSSKAFNWCGMRGR